jgi:hypothetical protein
VVLNSGTLPLNKAQARLIIFLNFGAQTVKRDPSYALSWNQLMAGVSWPILQNVTAPLPHLETKWMPSLQDFLSSIDSEIIRFSTQANGNMTSTSWAACSTPGNLNHEKSTCSITATCSLA